MAIQIAPSILSADFANLERDIVAVAEADWLHVDVMDGHFVPNLTLGLPVVERIAQVSPLPIDAHLMIEDPDRWAPRYAEVGATSVTFHLEAARDPRTIAADLRSLGARASCAIKPGTPVEDVLPLIDTLDMVLIMTVEPGFGGQSFMEDMMPKFRTLRAAVEAAGSDLWIQADGGVARETIATVVESGGDVLVAGSAVYGADDRGGEIRALRELGQEACHHC
ncbi:ribulose-phosphate 3-epimerase [Demequina sp. SYSU T00039]|uniref:Ribulose-phosphate 3-epimerase n=1 Tax=Demequina lignilytica TaxID=3051663 RepID=A0AAW7M830_9MICO|nr:MULTISPECIES: ribulose-phosphate 3-epimerase [unclassified Demequina]MDN4486681.1 ribulose-phosphate 3-epimerase [Demequina sp. SYSU T00039]MDN4489367.1 ribulose-phosphate 3-epimerase [Demequina sp. SYSU T00068]